MPETSTVQRDDRPSPPPSAADSPAFDLARGQGAGPPGVGVALSGGGFRAAAFHLGTLDALHQCGLDERITQLSTVSGGSFVGAKYALSLVEGHSFDAFFVEFYRFMGETDLVSLGLRQLSDGKPNTPSGRDDLIVAMTDVYARTLFCDAQGQAYRFSTLLEADYQLDELVLNTTEFRYGLAFRFQHSKSRAKIGNGRLFIAPQDAAQLRVADIVAASSCFPGGFEPLAFPFDFAWPDGIIPPRVEAAFTKDGAPCPVAMMDGGIFDNQGIDSLLLGGQQGRGELELFIISDVDQASTDLYPFPPAVDDHTGPTLGQLRLYGRTAAGLLLLSFVSMSYFCLQALRSPLRHWYEALVFAFSALVSLGLAAIVLWAYRKFRDDLLAMVPNIGRGAWEDIRGLRLDQIIDMLNLRMSSLLALTSKVFMKRIRSLVYRRLYQDERYQHKRAAVLIDELNIENDRPWAGRALAGISPASPALRAVCRGAALMPTTLWFDHPDQLPSLVASGQASTTLSLLKWLHRCHPDGVTSAPAARQQLWTRLDALWTQLNADPFTLLRERELREDTR